VPGTQPSFLNQITTIWSRLQPMQRVTLLLITMGVLAGLGSLVFFMNRVDYVSFYRDLNPEDAQAIAARLKELKQDFRVSADGSSIEVRESQAEVDKLRLEMAGSGLARSGRIGYEIFDKNQLFMTDFTEQVNLKRALEGELSRTISSLAEISEARVHLVLPKESLFDDKKEEAKASVFVRLKKDRELARSNIAGIVNLVAGAVQGLKTYNVSVVDEQARVLSRLPAGDGIQADYESGAQAQIEKELVAKVTSILEPVAGKGKVHANASVEVDFNSSEQTEETFNPTPPPVITSQQKTEERVEGANTPAGVPGTRSNQGADAVQSGPAAPGRTRQSEATDYEVSKFWRHTIQPKGAIRRISVAVLLDHKTVYGKASDGKPAASFQPRSSEELDSYRQLVLAAIGYNEERGDTVTLENIPFFSEPAMEEDLAPLPWYVKWQPYLIPGMKYTAFIVLFLLAYLLFVRPVRKRIFQSISAAAPALPAGQARQLGDGTAKSLPGIPGDKGLANAGAAGALTSGAQAAGTALDTDLESMLMKDAGLNEPGLRKYDILKKKVVEHAGKDPEQMSQLIRAWIHEKP